MHDTGRELIETENFVQRRIRHDLRDQRRMHRMSGPLSDNVAEQRPPDQSEVTNQIEDFVPAAFIRETQAFGVHYLLAIETYRASERRTADQTHVAHLIEFPRKSEGPGGSDLRGVALGRNLKLQRLPANERMVKENVAGKQKTIRRKDRDSLPRRFDRNRPTYSEVTPAAAIRPYTGFAKKIGKRPAAAIENRNLEVIDLDGRVIDAHAIDHAQQMLSGRNEHALAHQTGGVANASDVTPTRRDLKIVEVGSLKDDAGSRRSRQDAYRDRYSAVQSDAGDRDRLLNRCFKSQRGACLE